MRKNFPVTATEYIMADGSSIVSKTDIKGRITYVNPYFIEVSGYTEAELIGAPHNLVRHPDMPEQAFGDLWKTLKTGALWTALVKNRRKNGDYYWVRANVTPIKENGTVVGFMSVRTKPDQQEVQAADALYCAIREGSARGITVHKGRVERTGMRGWPARLRGLSLDVGMALGALLQTALFLLLAAQMQFAGTVATALPSSAVLVALGGAIVSLGFWYWLRTSIVDSLDQAIDMAGALAGGDLTHNVPTTQTNEMGQLLAAMQQVKLNLIAAMGDVRANVDSMNSKTGEIAAGTLDLSSRTEMQASSLEQTASSMEQFASTVMQNADSAQQANQLARSASVIAQQGGSVVVKVGATMDDISSAARKVADIISVIDGIAFQTNILALNAAVEAARAGEHGRGFAVVATEVRHLAQRSAGAAKEIKTLIQTSVEKVDDGNVLVQEARRTMEEMVASVGRVTEIVADIATASREQASGIQQVNQAVSHMDQVTQQNAALVEQAAAASASLHQQAAQLMQAVSVFNFAGAARVRPALNLVSAPLWSAASTKSPAVLKLVDSGLSPTPDAESKVRIASRV